MTGETPAAHHDDTNKMFEALMSGNWEREPNLQEMIDAGIRRLFNEAKLLEDALNRAGEVTQDDIQAALLELNGDWDMLGYDGQTLYITGRLRPSPHAVEEEIAGLAEEDAFVGLGKGMQDVRGEYYPAVHMGLLVRGFSVETMSLGENKKTYRTTVQLGLDEDYSDDTTWFTAYPEELEYVEVPYPSREGTAEFIHQNFPELFEQLNILPDDCQDPELIRQALDDLEVTIDLSKTDSALGSEEILDIIETYITDRLSFDSAAYTLGIRGIIYGRKLNYEKIPADYQGELTQTLIGSVRLFPIDSTPDDATLVTYRPALEAWYLVPGSGQGRTAIYVPIDSLTKICELRPLAAQFPFSPEDLAIVSNEELEQEFMAVPLGGSALALNELEQGQAPLVDGSYDTDTAPSRAEYLEKFRHELRVLHEAVRPYVSTSGVDYDTHEEAKAVMGEVEVRIREFLARWTNDAALAEVEVSGDGLMMPDTVISRKVDRDNEAIVLSFNGMDMKSGDILTQRRGVLLSAHVDMGGFVDDDAEEKYAVRAILEFHDSTTFTPDMVIFDPYYGRPVVSTRTVKRFYVDLGGTVEYSMPELDTDARRREQMDKIAALPISPTLRDGILQRLGHLTTALENEVSGSYIEYGQVERLRDVALSVGEDEETAHTVAIALQTILGLGRSLRVSGPMYDPEGELVPEATLMAQLEGVIAAHPYIKGNEVALVVAIPANEEDETEQRYIVPLSTMESLAY